MSNILLIMPSDFTKVDMDLLMSSYSLSTGTLQEYSAGINFWELEEKCRELGWLTAEQVVDACHYVEETNEFYIKFA